MGKVKNPKINVRWHFMFFVDISPIFLALKANKACHICGCSDGAIKCNGVCSKYYHFFCILRDRNKTLLENGLSQNNNLPELTAKEMQRSLQCYVHLTYLVVGQHSTKYRSVANGPGLLCDPCRQKKNPPCCLCLGNQETDLTERYPCNLKECGNYYHQKCLEEWSLKMYGPQASTSKENIKKPSMCPKHVCHPCTGDQCNSLNSKQSLVSCIKCVRTYHRNCVPAGAELLTTSQMICPVHYPKKDNMGHCNINWCDVCFKKGNLLKCAQCPMAVHPHCLNFCAPTTYVCKKCQIGRQPLYGEIVWAKMTTYRWWPAQIILPSKLPESVSKVAHEKGDFPVKFFGTFNYTWTNRERVYKFYKEDASKIQDQNLLRNLQDSFTRAVRDAKCVYEILQTKAPKYRRLSRSIYVGNAQRPSRSQPSGEYCGCSPDWKNPCDSSSGCLNRVLNIECNPLICKVGSKCCNRRLQNNESALSVPFKTDCKGWGLKTLQEIGKGDLVIEFLGEVIDMEEYEIRSASKLANRKTDLYFIQVNKDFIMDLESKGNESRFVNHSCDPNSKIEKWVVENEDRVGIYAIKDIAVGTEVTVKYNLPHNKTLKIVCKCGAQNCQGYL